MFALPPVGRYRLTDAPLVQALGQVRFPLQARLGTLDGIAAVQQELAIAFPYLSKQEAQDIEFGFGPDGPKAQVTTGVATYTFDSDEGHSVVLSPDTATLTVDHRYRGVDEFIERFELMLTALFRVTAVPRIDRLGVRYLNLAPTPPSDPTAWTRWFRPEIVGWVGAPNVLDAAAQVNTAITQVTFVSPASGELAGLVTEAQAVVRHGLAPKGSGIPGIPPIQVDSDAFVFDIDAFVVGGQSAEVAEVSSTLRALHGQIDRFFYWMLTEEGATHFGRIEG